MWKTIPPFLIELVDLWVHCYSDTFLPAYTLLLDYYLSILLLHFQCKTASRCSVFLPTLIVYHQIYIYRKFILVSVFTIVPSTSVHHVDKKSERRVTSRSVTTALITLPGTIIL